MPGIPLPLSTDAEDVVWSLQTAEALWKRGEADEALVWLRRSAEAAGVAEDDERALTLARAAAEMTDAIRSDADAIDVSTDDSADTDDLDAYSEDVLIVAEADIDELADEPELSTHIQTLSNPSDTPTAIRALPEPGTPTPIRVAVFSRQAYYGSELQMQVAERVEPAEIDMTDDDDASEHPLLLDLADEQLTTPSTPRPPLPDEDEPSDPFPLVSSAHVPSAMPTTPMLDEPRDAEGDREAMPDLSAIEAFGDLPEDVREAFARAANVRRIGPRGHIGGVALALVVEGVVKVTGASEFPHIHAGGVVRLREDPDMTSRVELRAVSMSAVVASWAPDAVATAFSHCPWVDDDLRAAGDHLP